MSLSKLDHPHSSYGYFDPLAHTHLEQRVESVQGLPRLTQLTVKSGLLPEEGGVRWGESES